MTLLPLRNSVFVPALEPGISIPRRAELVLNFASPGWGYIRETLNF
jgi:hypothetical protein